MEVKLMELKTKNIDIPSKIVNIWQQVVNSVSELLSVPSVMINRLEPPELEVFRSNISPNNPFPSGTRMQMAGIYCEAAAKKRQRVQVIDARKDPLWVDSPTAKAGIFAYLGYPLFWPDGEVFGTICAVDIKENKWGKQYESLLQTFKDAIEMHLALVNTLDSLEKKNQELERTISEVKTLRGLLPICASCKKVRDDKGYWNQIDKYLETHSEVEFSHGLCPDCAKKLYPGFDI
jgi:GAF domain-containing protein